MPLRPRSPLFSFDAETGSRRPRWVVVVAALVALLLAVMGVVAGVSAATAHTPKVTADCYQLKVDLQSYNGTNHVYVEIDDAVKTDQNFGNSFSQTYTFSDPSVAHTWSVVVDAHDDSGDNGWDVNLVDQRTTPCAAPALDLAATICNSVGGTTNLTATISSLVGGQTYTGRLFKNNTLVDTFVATTAGKVWFGMEAGVTYKLTVASNSQPGLTKTIETFAVGCPQNSQLQVAVTECTSTTTSNASVSVTASSVVPGRSYTAVAQKNGTVYGTATFTPAAGITTQVFTIGLPENVTGLTVILTDVAANTTIESTVFSTASCPDLPTKPAVSVQECTEVGGSLEITVTLDGMVPGRAYLVSVDGTVVDTVMAGATSQGGLTYPVTAGTHTVTITDKLVPSIAVTSDPFDVMACPTQPEVSFSITECSVPGSTGTITATFDGLGTGRDYTVTITENGSAVPGYPAVTVTAGVAPKAYTGLDPTKTYTVTIVDELAPDVKDAESATLAACPMTPKVALTLECLFLDGDSLISAAIEDLEDGEQYEVTIEDDSAAPVALGGLGGGTAATALAAPVDSTTVTGGPTATTVTFQVPNNLGYTVTVTSVANPQITNSAQIFAAICDLPTFSLPPELPTLALTGASDTTLPMLGALGLVQFGVALLALAAMLQVRPKRRSA